MMKRSSQSLNLSLNLSLNQSLNLSQSLNQSLSQSLNQSLSLSLSKSHPIQLQPVSDTDHRSRRSNSNPPGRPIHTYYGIGQL